MWYVCDVLYAVLYVRVSLTSEFFLDSVYVDLQYDEISLTFTAGSVVMWSSVRLSWYPMWMRWLL